ncbi:hypothetical protein P154DRAFT_523889 [Amniculicola lignicola CBS 123094]|uniref:Secreted protein n=1 Tax=Amniculicola lignicola CBS 123094 TaxID=1392246 RepID=A0A6A5WEP7_9PLEO|nr:hypothetical protein P154DRAFT_523889 [Amniculicola lignicola CBS 123094]
MSLLARLTSVTLLSFVLTPTPFLFCQQTCRAQKSARGSREVPRSEKSALAKLDRAGGGEVAVKSVKSAPPHYVIRGLAVTFCPTMQAETA